MSRDNKESGTNRQHYVPVFYLSNFTDINGLNWVYDRKTNRIFSNIPENICFERFLYETVWKNASEEFGNYVLFNQIEKYFCERESKWSVLIRHILSLYEDFKNGGRVNLVCSTSDKESLYEFFSCTYFRNPIGMKEVVDFYADADSEPHVKEVVARIKVKFEEAGLGSPESLLRHSIKTMSFRTDAEGGPVNVLVNHLKGMHLCFLCDSHARIITSSFPTISVSELGDRVYQYFILPLSPKVAIFITDDPGYRASRNRFSNITEEAVLNINNTFVGYSIDDCRFLISNNKNDFDLIEKRL